MISLFFCRRQLVAPLRLIATNFTTQFAHLECYPSIYRAFSNKPETSTSDSDETSFTVSYLVKTWGLTLKEAKLASKWVNLANNNPQRADLLLSLLRKHGFSDTQIALVAKGSPLLLNFKAEKTLLPKLKFFTSLEAPPAEIIRCISLDPSLLSRSLNRQIVPCYNFLKSVLHCDKKVVNVFRRCRGVCARPRMKRMVHNIELLQKLGVPERSIKLLLAHYPEAITQDCHVFEGVMNEVVKMGFDPLKSVFVLAIHAMSGDSNKRTWDRCHLICRKWGWSEDEILLAIKKNPQCMLLSEEKLMKTMDYLVNKMGYPSSMIVQCPPLLFFSLEKRITPRCSVIKVLSRKGFLRKDLTLGSILVPPEKYFLEKYVTKYEKQLPNLMAVYQGKLDVSEL